MTVSESVCVTRVEYVYVCMCSFICACRVCHVLVCVCVCLCASVAHSGCTREEERSETHNSHVHTYVCV